MDSDDGQKRPYAQAARVLVVVGGVGALALVERQCAEVVELGLVPGVHLSVSESAHARTLTHARTDIINCLIVIVFAVPVGPIISAGRPLVSRLRNKNVYRTESIVGTKMFSNRALSAMINSG